MWVRDYNQQLVLHLVRTGNGMSRAVIAERTGLTGQAVTKIVRRLIAEGLVVESGKGVSLPNGGRPPVELRVNAEARYAVGAHVDRDVMSCVALNLRGDVLARAAGMRPSDPLETVGCVRDLVEGVIGESGVDRSRILGVGVACPGPLDPLSGVVYRPPGMAGWEEVRLKELLEECLGIPVVVDNDAIASAVGERWMGKGQEARNFAFVYMGWGMGAGLFFDGRVYRGSTGTAGEIGHVPLDPEGPECPCGNRGCLIRYCSPRDTVSAVQRRLWRGEAGLFGMRLESLNYGTICDAALAGDPVATEELTHAARMLGRALVGLVNALDLQLVVLGGKSLNAARYIYRREVEKALGETMLYRDRREVSVEMSQSGEDAGAVGAASLILHAAYSPQLAG
jgi:predicted NBD/HSP70 family sugar kinase